MRPLKLPPNQLHRFYRGGARIARLRRSGSDDPYAPEEWIASMASPYGEPGVGISRLDDGRPITEAIADDPEAFLGAEHLDRFGPDVAVLIKLLDAGQRLPVHFHPDDAFAASRFDSPGKTEAWVILEADAGASVQVGFAEDVALDDVSGWVDEQDTDAMLGALRDIAVEAGTTVYVPAGTPHAIGAGILLAELQQPTDLSLLLEWKGFADDAAAGFLGLSKERMLEALDRSVWDDAVTDRMTSGRDDGRPGVEVLFPSEADAFFRAERIRAAPTEIAPSFSVLLVTDGSGTARGDGWDVSLERGDAVLVPYAAGACELSGDLTLLRCMGPAL